MADGLSRKLGLVARRYEELVSGLPEPLFSLARSLPEALAPSQKGLVEYYGAREAYPLLRFPLWLEARYVKEGRIRPDGGYGVSCSLASLYGYLYIRIQDNVLDEPEMFDSAYLLLGNEFIREFFHEYHTLFDASSAFWGFMREYWRGTTNNTLWERRACGRGGRGICGLDIAKVGGKLDGGKVSMAAMCVLAGREDDIARYGPVIDQINIASQLHNDSVSFIKDLRHDYFTCVIANTLGNGETDGRDVFTDASIRALTGADIEDTLLMAIDYNKKALALIGPGELPGLGEYVKAKNAHLEGLRTDITRLKEELLSL